MTKSAHFTSAELRRMADVAKSENVTVEMERNGTIVRVMPIGKMQISSSRLSREDGAEAALQKWVAEEESRKGVPSGSATKKGRHEHDLDKASSSVSEVTNPAGLAKRWMCSQRHIHNLIARGDLPAVKYGGRLVRIRWADIEAFEKSGGSAPRGKK